MAMIVQEKRTFETDMEMNLEKRKESLDHLKHRVKDKEKEFDQ